jgi:hypothetical protein
MMDLPGLFSLFTLRIPGLKGSTHFPLLDMSCKQEIASAFPLGFHCFPIAPCIGTLLRFGKMFDLIYE